MSWYTPGGAATNHQCRSCGDTIARIAIETIYFRKDTKVDIGNTNEPAADIPNQRTVDSERIRESFERLAEAGRAFRDAIQPIDAAIADARRIINDKPIDTGCEPTDDIQERIDEAVANGHNTVDLHEGDSIRVCVAKVGIPSKDKHVLIANTSLDVPCEPLPISVKGIDGTTVTALSRDRDRIMAIVRSDYPEIIERLRDGTMRIEATMDSKSIAGGDVSDLIVAAYWTISGFAAVSPEEFGW